MVCQRCGASCAADDNYCPKCGASLRGLRLPVPWSSRELMVPWEQVRTSLVQGVAVLALGTAAELLRREVRRRVTPSNVARALTRLWQARPVRHRAEGVSVPVHVQPSVEAGAEVAEVRAFFFRRVVVRR